MEHELISLTETIKQCLDDGETVIVVFIDLQKAFDTVNHEFLLEKLKYCRIRSKRMIVFDPFLSTENYVSIEASFSQTKIVKCGVPQGFNLGPFFLFILMI